MNLKYFLFIIAAVFLPAAVFAADYPIVPGTPRAENNKTTPGYESSRVDTRFNVDIGKETRVINIIRDTNNPFVITKAYELKKANPFAIRGYLLDMVKPKKISSSDTSVDAILYNDGTALVLVSAEEYRFNDTANGEGFDSIIARLDKQGLAFYSGTTAFVYYPKASMAANL